MPRLVVEASPDLSWKPVAGATAYIVEMIARVPEGRVVERRSTRVDSNRVDAPRLDASRPTKISLAVTAVCGTLRSKAVEETILVMPAPTCPPLHGLKMKERTISWPGAREADVEARAFDAFSGALVEKWSGRSGRSITIPGDLPSVVAVRQVCGSATGPASYLFVE